MERTSPADLTVFVPGMPKGQPRGRAFVRRNGRAGIHDPGTANGYKAMVGLFVRQAAEDAGLAMPIHRPIAMRIEWLFPRPKRLMTRKSPKGRIWHVSKPDDDNLEKAVKDAITDAGVWADDSLCCRMAKEKVYAAVGEEPGTWVAVSVMRTDEAPDNGGLNDAKP
jgi:Holliday junction resolvase RusA-like endonuclease